MINYVVGCGVESTEMIACDVTNFLSLTDLNNSYGTSMFLGDRSNGYHLYCSLDFIQSECVKRGRENNDYVSNARQSPIKKKGIRGLKLFKRGSIASNLRSLTLTIQSIYFQIVTCADF